MVEIKYLLEIPSMVRNMLLAFALYSIIKGIFSELGKYLLQIYFFSSFSFEFNMSFFIIIHNRSFKISTEIQIPSNLVQILLLLL